MCNDVIHNSNMKIIEFSDWAILHMNRPSVSVVCDVVASQG